MSKLRLTATALLTSLALAATRPAIGQTDPTLDSVQQRLRNAVLAAKEKPLAQSPEAGQVITALRSTNDKDLLSLFQKIRQSKAPENQVYAMVAGALLAKQAGMDPESPDFKFVDLKIIFATQDGLLIGSAIAGLIDAQALSIAQLKEVMTSAPDTNQRAMAAGELIRLKKLDDRAPLMALLKDDKPAVRYYAAVSLFTGSDAEQKAALTTLKELTAAADLRHSPVQALMLVRMRKENLTAGAAWAAQIASDEKSDDGLRLTALATLMALKAPESEAILHHLISKLTDPAKQEKLAMIALEYAATLKKETFDPLVASQSNLAKTAAVAAQKAASQADNTTELLNFVKEGHPIVLDWALDMSERAAPERRLALRLAVVNQATVVDGVHDRDYERAALAAEKIMNEDGDAGRKAVAEVLRSENRAAVEATLAGIYRSTAKNQSELVLRIWDGLTKTNKSESAANYAALILAREGHQEALTWLPGMFLPGTSLSTGFRALSGWYYAKLKGQSAALLQAVTAD